MVCEVAALRHEARDHSMEDTAFEVEWLLRLCADTFLSCAQGAEVLGSFWRLCIEMDHNATFFGAHYDVHEYLRVNTWRWRRMFGRSGSSAAISLCLGRLLLFLAIFAIFFDADTLEGAFLRLSF